MTISKVDVNGFLFQHFSMFQLTHIMQLYYVLEYETKKNMRQKHNTLDSLQRCQALNR